MRKRWLCIALVTATLALLIGIGPASAAPQAYQTVHVVQWGETLYSIARHYGMNVWTIARANGLVNPNHIYVGQRLIIPTCQPSGVAHVVQPGETLTGIAWRYGVSAWAIARANGLTNLNHIYVGQRLTIPGATPSKPTPTKTPSPSLPSSFPGPWSAEYFDNASLSGSPYTTRTDETIKFNWGYGVPAGGMPSNHFSVRWKGTFDFEEGTYRFYAKVDDGVRVYVDGERIIDGWRDGGLRLYTADRTLSAGEHTVQVEYYDSIQVARIYAWWKQISAPTPTATPVPDETPAPEASWFGQFYNGEDLEGSPVTTSYVSSIGFDWGAESPAPGVWADHFSARWTRQVHLKTDHYRFCAMSDDGVRIWVDDTLVLDAWHPNDGTAYCKEYWGATGTYDVKVEYYEDGGNALIYVWWEPH